MKVSYDCRSVDAVDAAAFLFGRGKREPELLLQRAREDAAHGVALATSSIVAPSGRRSIAITPSCFDGRFASDWGSGSGKASIAGHN